MPRGQFKHRYWFFADTPNIARNYRVIWKDLWWRADCYRIFKHRGGRTISLFQLSVCEKGDAARHCTIIGKQLLISNDRHRVRWVVLGLSQDGACTDLFENLSVNSLKGDLSNATTFNPPLFSLVKTFKKIIMFTANMFTFPNVNIGFIHFSVSLIIERVVVSGIHNNSMQ
jgi:hypothetical protein